MSVARLRESMLAVVEAQSECSEAQQGMIQAQQGVS